MRLHLNDDEREFRDRMREFFSTAVPREIRDKVAANEPLERDEIVTSHRILNAGGLAVPRWPVEWGGHDWTPMQHYLWRDELHRSFTPLPQGFNTSLLGPVIAEFGTPEQKQRYLPATANLDIWWAQGFSEPDAGSDLASLKTRAVLDGDNYVVNGQKTWTTGAHNADWIFALVRTDPTAAKRQQGISFLLIDLSTPGITVRPIRLLDGAREVNEVFFDNVVVPRENLVGPENQGWTCAKFLLGNERGGSASARPVRRQLERIKREAAATRVGSGTLLQDPLFAARVAELETAVDAFAVTVLRVASTSTAGKPSPISSMIKLRGSQLEQAAAELLMDVAGPDGRAFSSDGLPGQPWGPRATRTYLNTRKTTIYGGSSEVQRTIIASSILGM